MENSKARLLYTKL